jgi:hypothetical protein
MLKVKCRRITLKGRPFTPSNNFCNLIKVQGRHHSPNNLYGIKFKLSPLKRIKGRLSQSDKHKLPL